MPIHDATHVRNAGACFEQVERVNDAERVRAWTPIKSAAKKYDVDLSAPDRREVVACGFAPLRLEASAAGRRYG